MKRGNSFKDIQQKRIQHCRICWDEGFENENENYFRENILILIYLIFHSNLLFSSENFSIIIAPSNLLNIHGLKSCWLR